MLWGLYAAFFLCLEDILDVRRRFGPEWDTPLGKLVRRGYMFLLSIVSALLFRAESVGQLGVIFTRLVTQTGFGAAYLQAAFDALGLTALSLVQLALSIVVMARLYDWGRYDLPPARTLHGSARRISASVYFVLTIALCWLALLATQDAAIFAYFQF